MAGAALGQRLQQRHGGRSEHLSQRSKVIDVYSPIAFFKASKSKNGDTAANSAEEVGEFDVGHSASRAEDPDVAANDVASTRDACLAWYVEPFLLRLGQPATDGSRLHATRFCDHVGGNFLANVLRCPILMDHFGKSHQPVPSPFRTGTRLRVKAGVPLDYELLGR